MLDSAEERDMRAADSDGLCKEQQLRTDEGMLHWLFG
jgi:hypothetical protein